PDNSVDCVINLERICRALIRLVVGGWANTMWAKGKAAPGRQAGPLCGASYRPDGPRATRIHRGNRCRRAPDRVRSVCWIRGLPSNSRAMALRYCQAQATGDRSQERSAMLSVGSFPTRDCQGVTRRAFVRAAFALPFAWGLPGPLGGQ